MITAIVIGIAFSILSIVQKNMFVIQNNYNQAAKFNTLKQSLWIDFHKYTDVRYDNKNERLIFSSEVDSASYQLNMKEIISERDTFNLQIAKKTLFFNGNPVNQGNVDAIKIELTKEFQSKTLFVFKTNDATVFMN